MMNEELTIWKMLAFKINIEKSLSYTHRDLFNLTAIYLYTQTVLC